MTGLGGDLSPLERSIREDMRVDTGFPGKRVCARNSPILVGDDFRFWNYADCVGQS
jgi:hypothetical protein